MPSSSAVESRWSRVGRIPPVALTDARLQLHHAVQIVVSAAISYVPPRSDDSHTALTWLASQHALVSEPIAAATPVRIGVRVEDLTLLLLGVGLQSTRTFALIGRTVADSYAWLRDVAAEVGLDPARLTERKHYTIPAHAVADGAAFSDGTGNELIELARYWANAGALLDELARATVGASAVRAWPHHFDIATLVEIPAATGAQRTIGIGQSPGDDWYAEPYWYVGPKPYPATHDLPALAGGGHWHTTEWVGAALPASAFIESADQRAQVVTFIDSAVAACRNAFVD